MGRSCFIRWLLVPGLLVGTIALVGCGWFGPQHAVDFSFGPASGGKPLLVDFTPDVTGNPTSYAWDFGDGSTSSEHAPSHVYYTAGKYSVRLTVVYEGEPATILKADCIQVLEVTYDVGEKALYWLDAAAGTISSGPLAGGTVTPILAELPNAHGLAFDTTWMYWTEGNVVRAALHDGTYAHDVQVGARSSTSVCVDTKLKVLFWTALPETGKPGGMMRGSTNPAMNRQDWAFEWNLGDAVPLYVAVDPATARLFYFCMYYAGPTAGAALQDDPVSASIGWAPTDRLYLDGHTIIISLGRAGGMAVDTGLAAGARYIYWSNAEGGRINRCKVDGSEFTWLINGLAEPKGVAVDIEGGKLYWSDLEGIHRANLDGTGRELIYPDVKADCLSLG